MQQQLTHRPLFWIGVFAAVIGIAVVVLIVALSGGGGGGGRY